MQSARKLSSQLTMLSKTEHPVKTLLRCSDRLANRLYDRQSPARAKPVLQLRTLFQLELQAFLTGRQICLLVSRRTRFFVEAQTRTSQQAITALLDNI